MVEGEEHLHDDSATDVLLFSFLGSYNPCFANETLSCSWEN